MVSMSTVGRFVEPGNIWIRDCQACGLPPSCGGTGGSRMPCPMRRYSHPALPITHATPGTLFQTGLLPASAYCRRNSDAATGGATSGGPFGANTPAVLLLSVYVVTLPSATLRQPVPLRLK